MLRGIASSNSFSSKLDESGGFVAQKSSEIEELEARTELFLKFARGLPPRETVIPVYRTIKPATALHERDIVTQPLPFSSTLSLAFALRNWAHTAEHVILEFDVPEKHPAIALAHLGGLTQVVPKNQGQLEITVAPGRLRVTAGPFPIQNRLLYKAVLEPVADSDLRSRFGETIEALKQTEALKPSTETLDESQVQKEFSAEDARKIVELGPQLATNLIPDDIRTFTSEKGRWVLHSWDNFFGYLFALHKK